MKTIGEPNLFSKFFGVRFKGDEISLLFFGKRLYSFNTHFKRAKFYFKRMKSYYKE